MKRFISLVFFIFLAGIIYADQIHKVDRSIINGKVIQITKRNVEFDPEGPKAFDFLPRNQVLKIVYEDGRTLQVSYDKMYFFTGKVIEGTIKKVNQKDIQYYPKGTENDITIERTKISRIQFSDGKILRFRKSDAQGTRNTLPKEEPVVRVDGFHKSFIRILGYVGGGGITGAIDDTEDNFLAQNLSTLNTNHGNRDYEVENGFITGGADLDIMLPAFEFDQDHVFDFTGIKLGVRGRYGYVSARSFLFDDDDDDRDSTLFDGELLKYHYWAVGPVIDFIFSTRSNNFNLIINMYGLFGRTFGGHLSAAPTFRDAGVMTGITSSSDYSTGFDGYAFRFGFGPHFALNKWFPVTVGINYTFGVVRMKLDHPLNVYNDANEIKYLYQHGFEVSLGLHF